ncbi:hypothetical protein PIB30_093393 [Stylosanthes scabra]|uniref:Uncharacterized protein n=1 Tax=Stylosanthes scabra TaxID=79078 RepID=A0ABU6YUE7_9FABA|nr:hypothetical protein [Stylosanthes scabra]
MARGDKVRQRGADGDHLPLGDEAAPPGVANDSLHCVVRISTGSVGRFTWLAHKTSSGNPRHTLLPSSVGGRQPSRYRVSPTTLVSAPMATLLEGV